LKPRELSYLIGHLQFPANPSEVKIIQDIYNKHFNTGKKLSYLLDDRYRLIGLSNEFAKTLGVSVTQIDNAIGKSFIRLLIDPIYKMQEFFSPDDYGVMLRNIFYRYYHEVGFMIGDEYFLDFLKAINENLVAKKIWNEIVEKKGQLEDYQDTRKVAFTMNGMKISMEYSIEPMQENNRFELIEYVPTGRLFKLLAKL